MKRFLRILGWSLGALAAVMLVAYVVISQIATRRYERVWTAHEASFPIPFPLGEAELAGVDLQALALQHAVERGKHLIDSRVGCGECHGKDFGGGVVIDVAIAGRWVAPNLTPHETGLKGWTEADFIRALREGRRKNGTTISPYMPWKAYAQMSDDELKAIWAYLRTVPAVEKGNR